MKTEQEVKNAIAAIEFAADGLRQLSQSAAAEMLSMSESLHWVVDQNGLTNSFSKLIDGLMQAKKKEEDRRALITPEQSKQKQKAQELLTKIKGWSTDRVKAELSLDEKTLLVQMLDSAIDAATTSFV